MRVCVYGDAVNTVNTDIPEMIVRLIATIHEKEHKRVIREGKRRSYDGASISGRGVQ